jgi:hypothetical protein
VANAEIGEVSGRRGSHRRDGSSYCGQERIQPHASGRGQRIELGYALQHMVLSELACIVTRYQAPDELFSVIGQITPPDRR